jgi:hypothetical protein
MRDLGSLCFLNCHTFVCGSLFGGIKLIELYPLNKLPHTKVQYLPRVREPKSHNLLLHTGTVYTVYSEAWLRRYVIRGQRSCVRCHTATGCSFASRRSRYCSRWRPPAPPPSARSRPTATTPGGPAPPARRRARRSAAPSARTALAAPRASGTGPSAGSRHRRKSRAAAIAEGEYLIKCQFQSNRARKQL